MGLPLRGVVDTMPIKTNVVAENEVWFEMGLPEVGVRKPSLEGSLSGLDRLVRSQ